MRIDRPPKEVRNIIDRLIQHPAQEIGPRKTQQLSRYKSIRYLTEKKLININKGWVSAKQNVIFKPDKNGYNIKIKW